MAAGGDVGYLQDAALFLGAAVVAVPIFKRLKLGSVLGYLGAGAIIGPHVLGLVGDTESVYAFSEFGVVLLLFIIGLELKPSRLWALRADIFGLGTSQVFITAAVVAAFGVFALGATWQAAVLVGMGLSLSSTAFALQLMQESGDFTTPYGTRAFSVLLLQDIMIAPILALAPLLAIGAAAAGGGGGWLAALESVGAIIAMVLAGKFLLNPIFRVIAQTRSHEIFLAAALLLVVGAALLMHTFDLSMALGAFIAGVMLADSEYRHQIEADIEPFRGLLLGLFFIAVGMSVDWAVVAREWVMVLGGAILLMIAKGAILFVLCRAFKSPKLDAARIATTLPQGGEFGFVVMGAGVSLGILTGEVSGLLLALITVSMALTVPGRILFEKIVPRLWPEQTDDLLRPGDGAEQNSVIVLGFGRVGQIVSQIFRMKGIPVTAIDADPKRIQAAKRFGAKVYFGDATRQDVLAAAGMAKADLVYVTIDNAAACTKSIDVISHAFPNVRIMARAHDRLHAIDLLDSGADFLIRDTFESSVKLAEAGLKRLDVDEEEIELLVEEFRRADADRLALQKAEGVYATAEDGGSFRLDKS
ncbi:MAG: monovalent cation:proton antiporter-2 (CPA2) family protein [Alphaproteobacteria bacterium]